MEETYPGHEKKRKKERKMSICEKKNEETFFIVQTGVLYVSTSRVSKSRVSTLLTVRSVEILQGFPDFLDRGEPFYSSYRGGGEVSVDQHASIFGPTSIKSGTVHIHFRS